MKHLRQLFIILAFCFAGEFLSRGFNLPIPGSVVGLILLLVSLLTGFIKPKMIEEVADFLIDNLAFFFIPAGVGLITSFDLIKNIWLPILLICLGSTVLVMITTGHTVQFIKRRKEGRIKDEQSDK